MRRALLLAAALAVPAVAAAQATGEVQFVEPGTTNDITHGKWINAAKCAAKTTTNVILQWKSTVAPGANGKYQIFAASQDMAASSIECQKTPNTASGLKAGQVGVDITDQLNQTVLNVPETVDKFLTAVEQTSCEIQTTVVIYVCVQAVDSTGKSVGFAKGQLKFEVAKPGKPTGVSADPLETGKLKVRWIAPSGSPQAYDYIVTAHSVVSQTDLTKDSRDMGDYQAGPTDPHADNATIGGLTDGILYAVYVVARSEAANESAPPGGGPGFGIPQVVNDFWDQYRATPGAVEQGGCATAGAGPLALLGLAALAAALRRRA